MQHTKEEIQQIFSEHVSILMEELGEIRLIDLILMAKNDPVEGITQALSRGYFIGKGLDITQLEDMATNDSLK